MIHGGWKFLYRAGWYNRNALYFYSVRIQARTPTTLTEVLVVFLSTYAVMPG
jgi:hypothetical protein